MKERELKHKPSEFILWCREPSESDNVENI